MTAEFILAAILLTSPPITTTAEPGTVKLPASAPDAWLVALRPSLLALAIDAELVDPREINFLLVAERPGDLATIQRRQQELANAPRAAEADRFPDRKQINEVLTINRALRTHLAARLVIDLFNADDLQAGIIECDRRYQEWDAVRDAACPYYYITVRRQALQLLRDLIGERAFYAGEMPPPVPLEWLPPR